MTRYLLTACVFFGLSGSLAAQEQTEALQPLPDYPRVLVTTSAGDFVIELFTKRAPITVHNFVEYVNNGFYNGTLFHRIVGGFVVQGGGYDADYKLKQTRALIPNESGNGLSNRREFVAMARTGDPHSANSQFFINLGDNIALDPRPTRWGYTVFGRVVEGMEVVDEIGYQSTGPGPVPELSKDVPIEPIVVTSMSLLIDNEAEDNEAEDNEAEDSEAEDSEAEQDDEVPATPE
jgi:peptidyl-prolyl cis-trans isomerase A (cyclophilin A)